MINILSYAEILCQIEMLGMIKDNLTNDYPLAFTSRPENVEKSISELDGMTEILLQQVEQYKQDNSVYLTKIAKYVGINEEEKTHIIDFDENINDTITLCFRKRKIQLEEEIKDAYKRYNGAWRLDVKKLNLRSVEQYTTEELLRMR